jgi:hypothetical protein
VPIEVNCPQCGRLLRAPDSAAGRRAKCPQCGDMIQLPGGVMDAEAFEAFEAFDDSAGGPVSHPPRARAPGQPPPLRRPAGADEFDEHPVRRPHSSSAGRQDCPSCGESIKINASRCRYCGVELQGGPYRDDYGHHGGQGMAIAAMVLGIVALVLICLWPVSLVLAALAVVFAGVEMKKAKDAGYPVSGMAIAGFVCGLIPLAILAVWLVIFLVAAGAANM